MSVSLPVSMSLPVSLSLPVSVSRPAQRARPAATAPVDEQRVRAVTLAARSLSLEEPRWRYACLSLCVLDAVFSPGTRYEAVRRLVDRYAAWASISTPRVPRSVPAGEGEQGIAVLARQMRELGTDRFAAEVLGNRQRTHRSPHAPLKTAAALEFAERLLDAGAHTRAHLARLRRDEGSLLRLDESLATVPGHGSGQRLDYFHLLAGDDHRVVPNRYLLGWLSRTTKSDVAASAVAGLVRRAASELGVTPAALGDAVWRARKEPSPGFDDAESR